MKGDIKFEIYDDHALASNDQGVILFGRLIEIDRPLDFPAVLKAHLPDDYQKSLVPIPKRLPLSLKLASAVHEANQDYASTKITCSKEIMSFLTRTDRGEVLDKFKAAGHPDVEVTLSCSLVEDGLKPYDKMLATDRGMIMANGKGVYLVAAGS
jgi:hypothetical protein